MGNVPRTFEPPSAKPEDRSREIIRSAALKAAAVSGTLSLPPGPAGLLTVIPDMLAVWRIQGQMVADIAGAHGKGAALTREELLYCLFRHSSGSAVRDFVVRAGERVVVRRATRRSIEQALESIGVRVTERFLGRTASRWIPLAGALGMGAWAYMDTARTGRTAVELFRHRIVIKDVGD
jgi:hypothetical protein